MGWEFFVGIFGKSRKKSSFQTKDTPKQWFTGKRFSPKNVRIQAGNNVRIGRGQAFHDRQSWNSRKSPCFQAFCGGLSGSREPGGQPVLVHFTKPPIMSVYQILRTNKMSYYWRAIMSEFTEEGQPQCVFQASAGRGGELGRQPVLVHFTKPLIMSEYQILHTSIMSDYRRTIMSE